jgi:hypothetical protein
MPTARRHHSTPPSTALRCRVTRAHLKALRALARQAKLPLATYVRHTIEAILEGPTKPTK